MKIVRATKKQEILLQVNNTLTILLGILASASIFIGVWLYSAKALQSISLLEIAIASIIFLISSSLEFYSNFVAKKPELIEKYKVQKSQIETFVKTMNTTREIAKHTQPKSMQKIQIPEDFETHIKIGMFNSAQLPKIIAILLFIVLGEFLAASIPGLLVAFMIAKTAGELGAHYAAFYGAKA